MELTSNSVLSRTSFKAAALSDGSRKRASSRVRLCALMDSKRWALLAFVKFLVEARPGAGALLAWA